MSEVIVIYDKNTVLGKREKEKVEFYAKKKKYAFIEYEYSRNFEFLRAELLKLNKNKSKIRWIELIAHGSQVNIDGFDVLTGSFISLVNTLKILKSRINSSTTIYLSGCLTGIAEPEGRSIAELLSRQLPCRVAGSRGFISGFITVDPSNVRTECKKRTNRINVDLSEIGCHEATGRECWKFFQGKSHFENTELTAITMYFRGFLVFYLPEDIETMRELIQNVLKKQRINNDFPRLGYEVSFEYYFYNSESLRFNISLGFSALEHKGFLYPLAENEISEIKKFLGLRIMKRFHDFVSVR